VYGCSGLCGFGDMDGMGDMGMPWGYLGQDDGTDTGGFVPFGPDVPPDITVGDVVQYASSGTTTDPSVLDQVANIFKTAAPAVNSILQQVQFGSLATNVPLSQLPQLRAAVTGAPVAASAVISSVLSNPTVLLIGAGILLFMLSGRGKRQA
jgi:hypothetical protein